MSNHHQNNMLNKESHWTSISWIMDGDTTEEEDVHQEPSGSTRSARTTDAAAASATTISPYFSAPGFTYKPETMATMEDSKQPALVSPETGVKKLVSPPSPPMLEINDDDVDAVTEIIDDSGSGGEDDNYKGLPYSWRPFWTGKHGGGEDAQRDVLPEDEIHPEEHDEVEVYDISGDDDDDVPLLGDEDYDDYAATSSVWGKCRHQMKRALLKIVQGADATKAFIMSCCVWVVGGLLHVWGKTLVSGYFLKIRCSDGLAAAKSTCLKWTTVIMAECQDVWTKAAAAAGPYVGPISFGAAVVILLGSFILSRRPIADPTNDLREFVRFEKANNVVDMKEIDELNTEAFRTYARSTCVEAATFEQAQDALSMGLYGVPDSIRNSVVKMAILKGVTQKNSVQDSNSDFVNQGKADAFMAFWSTVYDPYDSNKQAYKTCVMVTGVALTVAETVAEWTSKQEKYQVGTTPCHCGYVYCEECPVFDTREVTWPIFERRSLSLRKQEELRRWMIDQAVKSAEHLVLDGSANLALDAGKSNSKGLKPSFAWTGASSAAFFGEHAHLQDRVPKRRIQEL